MAIGKKISDLTNKSTIDLDEIILLTKLGGINSVITYSNFITDIFPRFPLSPVATSNDYLDLDNLPDLSIYLEKANNLSDLSSASSARTNLGLVIGTDVQAFSGILNTLSLLPSSEGFLFNDGTGILSYEDSPTVVALTDSRIGVGGVDNLLTSIDGFSFDIVDGLSCYPASKTIKDPSTPLVSIHNDTSRSSFITSQDTPSIVFRNSAGGLTASVSEIVSMMESSNDTGSIPLCSIIASGFTGSLDIPVLTRPLLAGYNHTVKLWEVGANGEWNFQGNNLGGVGSITSSGVLGLSAPFINIDTSDVINIDSQNAVNINGDSNIDLQVNGVNKVTISEILFSHFTDISVEGGAEIGGLVTGNCVVEIVSENIADNEGRYFFAGATHNSNQRFSEIGVFTHPGITNSCSYILLSQESGQLQYIWVDNVGQVRISQTQADIGTTNGFVIGTQTSDERIKNIKEGPFSYGLNEILQLSDAVIEYSLKQDIGNTKRLGFSAQKTRESIPEMVFESKENWVINGELIENILGMNTEAIIPVLVKAIEELHDMIQAQKQEIELLKLN